jgi:hypothetical protein
LVASISLVPREVTFYDLPEGTVERLWERISTGELRERDWFDTLFKEEV